MSQRAQRAIYRMLDAGTFERPAELAPAQKCGYEIPLANERVGRHVQGVRHCKNPTRHPSGRCHLHQSLSTAALSR